MAETVCPEIVWVDSSTKVNYRYLENAGFEVRMFNEVQPAMDYITKDSQKKQRITLVITSLMRSGGRLEKGLPDGFRLADHVKNVSSTTYTPLLAMVTRSAKKVEALKHGFTIFERKKVKVMEKVVRALTRKKVIRIVHISDTHQLLTVKAAQGLPPGDVLIHTGDFTDEGTIDEYKAFDAVLASVAHKYKERVVILGNHDCRTFGVDYAKMASLLPHATHIPIFEVVNLLCGRVYGSPWWPGHTWSYRIKANSHDIWPDTSAQFDKISKNKGCFDILLTHGPPYGVLDVACGIPNNHSGSKEMAKAVKDASPQLHLWGHIHEHNGVAVSDGGTLCVNSSMRNKWGELRLQYPHHVILCTQGSSRWSYVIDSN